MAITLTVSKDGDFIFSGRSYSITENKNKLLSQYGKILHNYGIILETLPNSKHSIGFNQQIGNARFLRNRYLNDRINYYAKNKKTLSVSEYKKNWLPKLKEKFPFLKLSDKFSLEAALEHVDAAYKHFFDGDAKFPKFASKYKPSGNRYTTKFTNNNIRIFKGEDGLPYIKLPKIGDVRFILPKKQTIETLIPKGARITSASIKRERARYTVSLQIEEIIDKIAPIQEVSIHDMLAMDVGVKVFGVLGNHDSEEIIKNPRWIKIHAKRLRRFQKSLSRKQYDQETHTGSKNWEKARVKVAKEQRKCANQRKDFHHKQSRKIADRCKIFVCENLNIKGMMKNHHMAKSIASVGWGQFLSFVKYKLEAKGGLFVRVNRWYPSSQTCNCCGYRNKEVKNLLIRDWTCPKCGTYHDRDINAMHNILDEGIRMLSNSGITVAATA